MDLSTVHRTKYLCDDGGRKVARILGPNISWVLQLVLSTELHHASLSHLITTDTQIKSQYKSGHMFLPMDFCSQASVDSPLMCCFICISQSWRLVDKKRSHKSNILKLMCKHPKQQVQLHRISTWTQHMLVYSTAVNIKLWNITHTASSVLWLLTKYVEFDIMALLKWNQWIRPSGSVTSLKAQRGKWCTDWEDDSCVRKQNLLDVVIQSNLLQ